MVAKADVLHLEDLGSTESEGAGRPMQGLVLPAYNNNRSVNSTNDFQASCIVSLYQGLFCSLHERKEPVHGGRSMSRFVLVAVIVSVLTVSSTPAQQSPMTGTTIVPRLIRFGGTIANRPPGSQAVGVIFSLYKDEQGGAPLWLETQNVSVDESGRYTALLGATKAYGVPMDLFTSGEARWLGVQAEGQSEQERVLLVAVPYALKAADAETVGGLPPSAFAPAGSTVRESKVAAPSMSVATAASATATTTGTTGFVPVFTDNTGDTANSALFQTGGTGVGGNVGIGTKTPATKLDVAGGGTIRGALNLPATGTATSSGGKNSQPFNLTASSFKSGTGAQNQTFRWQTEPVGNNTTSPSGKLSLLFTSPAVALGETGFNVSSSGVASASSLRVGPDSFITAPVTKSPIDVSTFSAPILTLSNNSGGLNATAAIDFNTFQPSGAGTYNPSARIAAVDTGNFGNDIVFSSNAQGSQNNSLAERMRITKDGDVGLGTTVPTAKLEVVSSTLDGFPPLKVAGTDGNAVLQVESDGRLYLNTIEFSVNSRHLCLDPANYVSSCGSAAEYVPSAPGPAGYPSAADLVQLLPTTSNAYPDPHSPFVVTKTSKPCDENLIGYLLDPKLNAEGIRVNEHYLPLAIYGYFPAKVTVENGPIRRGDPITSSSKPGFGMKASGPCKIIGYALEDANHEGQIQVFAHLTENSSPHILRLRARMNRLRRDNLALHEQNAALQAQIQKQSESFQAALQNVLLQLQLVRVELQNRQAQAEVRIPVK